MMEEYKKELRSTISNRSNMAFHMILAAIILVIFREGIGHYLFTLVAIVLVSTLVQVYLAKRERK